MIVLSLTGSIGMGKSTTAAMFEAEGVPVHGSDAAVHALYARGGAAVGPVEAAFAGVTKGGAIDREALSKRVLGDPEALARLEAIVHPLVAEDRREFLARARASGATVAVLDIPLLYETARPPEADAVVVVTAPQAVQRERVLARPGMTEARLAAILARQTPDAEKRARADFVIDTGEGMDAARAQVRAILIAVRDPAWSSQRES